MYFCCGRSTTIAKSEETITGEKYPFILRRKTGRASRTLVMSKYQRGRHPLDTFLTPSEPLLFKNTQNRHSFRRWP